MWQTHTFCTLLNREFYWDTSPILPIHLFLIFESVQSTGYSSLWFDFGYKRPLNQEKGERISFKRSERVMVVAHPLLFSFKVCANYTEKEGKIYKNLT